MKEKLVDRAYGVILLERRDHDSTNHARFDGMVFLPAGTKYRYIRRLNDDHRLKLNTAQGREAAVARPEESAKFEKLIAENKLFPHVLLGKDGREALVVYCALRTKITWAQAKNSEIYLELRDPFKKEIQEFSPENSSFGIKNQ